MIKLFNSWWKEIDQINFLIIIFLIVIGIILSFSVNDSSLFIKDGEKVLTVAGSKKNLKITDKEDLNILKSLKRLKSY